MENPKPRLSDVGEKRLIAEYIRPLFNPWKHKESVGDDCALIPIDEETYLSTSTDRVPADLISFRLGLIDLRGLGYYLAVLNISDVAASGAKPCGLLLNLAFPPEFRLDDLLAILSGVQAAAENYGAPVLGGDLSTAVEMNLVGTAFGMVSRKQALFRSGARPGDNIFCSDIAGTSSTAFAYYLENGNNRPTLTRSEESLLSRHFKRPTPMTSLGRKLAKSGCCTSAMDQTDGLAQTLVELADASEVAFFIDEERLPIADVSRIVAAHFKQNLIDIVLGPGADFQLVGTLNPNHQLYSRLKKKVQIIGEVKEGSGLHVRTGTTVRKYTPVGWNYFV